MGYLTKIEAAIKLGWSVELIEYFSVTCPKTGENRTLQSITSSHADLFDEKELLDFQRYLNQPWPIPAKGTRPYIPKAISDDTKQECHYSCAICGYMDNGEVAHIHEVSKTLNNSPDNLVYLCPNHHTKYDYGYKLASNITIEEVEAAKKLKRMSRVRMLRYEANTTRYLKSVIETVARLERELSKDLPGSLRLINKTELQNLLSSVPELSELAQTNAKHDKDISDVEMKLAELAPSICAVTCNVRVAQTEMEVRGTARSLVAKVRTVVIDIDEVECPHCDGRGQRGLVGTLCGYCQGSCFVSTAKAEAYDPEDLDEVECPRCSGRGQTGLVGDLCAYCGGSCFVSSEQAEEYDEGDIDEVECPRCNGRGQTGLVGDLCAYCGGSCFVSSEQAKKYDENDIDEIECPRCNGTGQTGLVGDLCALCGGSTVVTEAVNDAYLEKFG